MSRKSACGTAGFGTGTVEDSGGCCFVWSQPLSVCTTEKKEDRLNFILLLHTCLYMVHTCNQSTMKMTMKKMMKMKGSDAAAYNDEKVQDDVNVDEYHNKPHGILDDTASDQPTTSVTSGGDGNNNDNTIDVASLRSKLRVLYSLQFVELVLLMFALFVGPSTLQFVQEDDCCGEPIQIGRIAKIASYIFISFIITQFVIWWYGFVNFISCSSCFSSLPTEQQQEVDDELLRSEPKKHPRYIHTLNWMTYINLYCIAIGTWRTLYRKSETMCFVLLALMGCIHLLHLICCIYNDRVLMGCGGNGFGSRYTSPGTSTKGITRVCTNVFHATSVIPFIAIVTMVTIYLLVGGMCYTVEEGRLSFTGCQLCEHDYTPPTRDNMCLVNETIWINTTDPNTGELKATQSNSVEEVELDSNPFSSIQDTYCANGANPTSFCFFAI